MTSFCLLRPHNNTKKEGRGRSASDKTHLNADQRLVVFDKHIVDCKQIIILIDYEILDYNIKFAAVCQRISRPGNKIFCLFKIEFKRYGKSERSDLARAVGRIASYFRKKLAIDICFFINLCIFLSAFVY